MFRILSCPLQEAIEQGVLPSLQADSYTLVSAGAGPAAAGLTL